MASLAIQLADEVAAYLNGATVGETVLSCVRKLIPESDLTKVKTLQIISVPHSLESKIMVRGGAKDRVVRIDVGVMKRAAESELEGLLGITQAIGDLLEGHRFSRGLCVEVAYLPLYDVNIWMQQQSFLAVVSAKIRVL